MNKGTLLACSIYLASSSAEAWNDFAFTPPAKQESYIEKWDNFAISSTTSYWQWIQKTEKTLHNNSLDDVTVEIIPHSSMLSLCLNPGGLAKTDLTDGKTTIRICARQLRYILHLLDVFTTSIMITSDDSAELKNALGIGDTKKAEKLLHLSTELIDAYSKYIKKQMTRDLQISSNDKFKPLSACGPDFFYLKMVLNENFMACTVNEQLSRLTEFDTWYFSQKGPGWLFSSAIKRETGQDIGRTDVKKYWDNLHETINRAAVIFILLHEAGHITNGDIQFETKTPQIEARADLWAMKKMIKTNAFSPPEILPYFLRAIIINVRYYTDSNNGNETDQPSAQTAERLKYFDEYVSELSKSNDSDDASRLQRQVLINLIKNE